MIQPNFRTNLLNPLVEISNRKILVLSGKTSDVPTVPTSADSIEGSNVSIGHLGTVADTFNILGIVAVSHQTGYRLTGLIPKYAGGRPSKLTAERKATLLEQLREKEHWATANGRPAP